LPERGDHLRKLLKQKALSTSAIYNGTEEAVFGAFLYQIPFLEESGLVNVEQYFRELPADEKPKLLHVFERALRCAICKIVSPEWTQLAEVPIDIVPTGALHGWHAFDERTSTQAIVVDLQHFVGLPRANAHFLELFTAHQLWKWTGKYRDNAEFVMRFLGLNQKPTGILMEGDDVLYASQTMSELVHELFNPITEDMPWMIEPEGAEWLSSVALLQQLFVALHELRHAQLAWAGKGPIVVEHIHLRGMNHESDSTESEDDADAWAAKQLTDRVKSGHFKVNAWKGDVEAFMHQERWNLPTEPTELVSLAILLYFEYLEAAGRHGYVVSDLAHRSPRERYDRVRGSSGCRYPAPEYVAEFRGLLSTVTTVAVFRNKKDSWKAKR
jgi:hypothetical protein